MMYGWMFLYKIEKNIYIKCFFSVGSFLNGEDDKGKKFWINLNFF